MKYYSTTQIAKKWNISSTRVFILAKQGKIPNAIQVASRWLIPENATKPEDGRKHQLKQEKDCFRFFIFDLKDENDYTPPLSKEEITLRQASLCYHKCEFEKSKQLLSTIVSSKNKYNRIFALFINCIVNIMLGDVKDFKLCYEKLYLEFNEDFPRKKELSFLLHEIAIILGSNDFLINDFVIDSNYSYHNSFLSHSVYLSVLSFFFSHTGFNKKELNIYELACNYLDNTTYKIDSQTLHFYLGIIYNMMDKQKDSEFHINKALEISFNYHLYWLPALLLYYYNAIIKPHLLNFSSEFFTTINRLSIDVHNRFNAFMEKTFTNNFFTILLSNEYIYVFYAMQGYTNKQVAQLLNTTESYVNNKYSKIYQKLNLGNKKELVNYYLKSNSNSIFSK